MKGGKEIEKKGDLSSLNKIIVAGRDDKRWLGRGRGRGRREEGTI